eukprot:m51a1_g3518 hypothetical protein (271) ;mRNA; r:910707-911751
MAAKSTKAARASTVTSSLCDSVYNSATHGLVLGLLLRAQPAPRDPSDFVEKDALADQHAHSLVDLLLVRPDLSLVRVAALSVDLEGAFRSRPYRFVPECPGAQTVVAMYDAPRVLMDQGVGLAPWLSYLRSALGATTIPADDALTDACLAKNGIKRVRNGPVCRRYVAEIRAPSSSSSSSSSPCAPGKRGGAAVLGPEAQQPPAKRMAPCAPLLQGAAIRDSAGDVIRCSDPSSLLLAPRDIAREGPSDGGDPAAAAAAAAKLRDPLPQR